MRVCYFGTYRENYARNRLMIDRLHSQGVEVVECHARLWQGDEDRQEIASGGWKKPFFWWRVISAYLHLLKQYRQIGEYDIMVVGYPGQPDIPLARVLTQFRRKPLVWDVLMSIYLITLERGIDQRHAMTVRLIHGLEHLCCHLPDLLIIDTQDYANWFQDEYGVRPQRIRLIPIGADDRIFTPQYQAEAVSDRFLCVYYGSFIPNHGVKTIIEAARLLSDDSTIHFELIGHGPDRDPAFELVKTYDLNNVTFTNWMDETSLIKRLALADVCLGTFGNTPQALMTMQNKIHEGLALAKPLINGDSPVMRSTLQHKEHIFLCKREDPLSLAEAIRTLKSDAALRMKLSTQGFLFYRDHFSFELLGKQFVHVLTSLDG